MSQPKGYAELEVALHRSSDDGYRVELRFTNPESEAEVPPEQGTAELDPQSLLTLHHDPKAYGEALAGGLLADSAIQLLWSRARTAAESADLHLRLRLLIGSSVPELQALRWELLRDPESGAMLATSEKILVSRFMLSRDWRPVRLQAKSELSALIAVSAPSNLGKFGLADVDLEGEVERASGALAGTRTTILGQAEPLTLERLIDGLRPGVDVVYLACHGNIHRKTHEPLLYLQRQDGTVGVAKGHDFAERIAELPQPPRLIVLASCESAGTESATLGDEKPAPQASLAPRLAEAGVPAVVAMQGKISMATVEQAMPAFFSELLADGQIDRALAVARGKVRERPDSWMPALYLRLKSGRIWYEPGFAGEDDAFKKWKSITSNVRQGTFVPIVGPDVGERFRGTHRELAERLAEAHGFPMADYQRTDLAKVVQYLAVHESRKLARDEVLKGWREQIRRRHPDLDSADLKTLFKDVARQRYQDKTDPFRILADLKASVYVNATADPMLPLSLAEGGAKPKPLFCNWRKTKDNHPKEPDYDGTPSAENPVIYYAFGFLAKGDSMVLAEDDFVDYLIAAADYKLIPRVVRGTLVKSSLLFLGFTLDDWAFRVLFRLIMSLDGSAQLADYAHVGVQIDPSEHSLADVERAREYLQEYFSTGRDTPPIDIYWGSSIDFLNELKEQLEKTAGDEPEAIIDDDEDEDDWL